jgi:hypothetical protein
MPRLRKAYAVTVDGYDEPGIFFAPTASKAKYATYIRLSDTDSTVSFQHMRATRSPANDVTLPDEHRLVAELDAEDRHIIAHAYGSDVRMGKEGYRDHYCTEPSDMRLLRLAWEFGLFSGPHGAHGYAQTDPWSGAFFYLTDLGKAVARSMLPTYR